MSDDQPIYRPGRIIAGRYRITSPLSQGGMGAVYLAQQVSLGRDVALKVILERGSDPELIKRFDIEARAVCQLKHPNIITYHDYGRDEDGQPFLVMEFLAGYPGSKLVYGDRRPRVQDLVHVVAQVCSALNEAHQKGIIHRDLKWSNVMICPQSHDPYFAKLIDFGIMKVATDGSSGDQRAMTRTGMLLGTPEYMSPEAICGMPIDGRADQYSLAVMLWEALEGERPFQAASHFELLRQQVQEPPPPFSHALPVMEAHPQLAEVIHRALEKHPDDRFEDILAFQAALMAAISGAANGTQPARPAAQKAARPTPMGLAAPVSRSGMPAPKSGRLGAATGDPRPVDTRVKTGREPAEAPAKRGFPWAIAAGLLLVGGASFAAVMALGGGEESASAQGADLVAAADTGGGEAARGDTGDTGSAVAGSDTGSAVAGNDTGNTKVAAAEPDAASGPEVALAAEDSRVAMSPDAATDAGPSEAARDVSAPTEAVAATVKVGASEPARKDSAPRVDPGGAALPKERVSGEGKLTLMVAPWAKVTIDGQDMGNSPLIERPIKAGKHTVTLTNPAKFKGAYSFAVSVKAGGELHRSVNLEDHLEKVD